MYSQELKIPKERIGVLIGKKGEIKRELEKRGNVKIDVDSEHGDVVITGKDAIMIYDIKIIVQAIGRGFSPEIAMQLFNEDYIFELIDIKEYAGKSKKKMERLRGRVIGENGKARRMIESMTETDISIYGKTIGIIGNVERVAIARHALEMLLSGAPHGYVYKRLEAKRRELHRIEFEERALL